MTPPREQTAPAGCPEDRGDEDPRPAGLAASDPTDPESDEPEFSDDVLGDDVPTVLAPQRKSGPAPAPFTPSPEDAEELAWIERAKNGDKEAFEAIVVRYQDRVWRRALYRLGDADEAWDVAQDVLVTCFRKLHQFRGESRFWSWLGRVVDNHVKNRHAWHERRGRSKTFSLDAPRDPDDDRDAYDPPDPGAGPRRQAESAEAMGALNEALGRLGEDHREILLLRFADGLAYEEIAETLEISLGTVKSRINRARAELRVHMKEHLE